MIRKVVEQTLANNFYKFLCYLYFFLIAYDGIKKKAVSGLNNVVGKNVVLSSLCSLSKELLSKQYKFVIVRRLYIDKPQGVKDLWKY